MQTVPIQQLVAEVVASYKLPVGRTPPTILAPDGALKCVIDAKKTSQALLNVLSNAYKYSQAPGTVAIQLGHQSGAVTIGVTDQGIGMTPAQTARVGERFYRADTSGKVPGTGLGMTIVSEIMALHHGSVTIHSEKGVGTTVTLQFPDVTMPVAESN
jgi:signal transduction histidine kinase